MRQQQGLLRGHGLFPKLTTSAPPPARRSPRFHPQVDLAPAGLCGRQGTTPVVGSPAQGWRLYYLAPLPAGAHTEEGGGQGEQRLGVERNDDSKHK